MAKSKTINTTKETSKGICEFCQGEFEKAKMTQHLKHCKKRMAKQAEENASEAEKSKLFHLVVEGRYLPMYWMHLEMPADATLSDLDDFLRYTWLECCGHLSAFNIGKATYSSQMEDMYYIGDAELNAEKTEEDEETAIDEASMEELSPIEVAERLVEVVSAEFGGDLSDVSVSAIEAKLPDILENKLGVAIPPEMQAKLGLLAHFIKLSASIVDTMPREYDMDVELSEVLKVGLKFTHEYDFGSTTELSLRVVGEREGAGAVDEDGDELAVLTMARNEPPVIPCRNCGKPATKTFSGYYSVDDGAVCDTCARKHRHEYEDMTLPIVNSPRVGVCGYTGPSDEEWDGEEEEWDEEEEE